MYILFSNKEIASSETRGKLLYEKYIQDFDNLEIIETSVWNKFFLSKILILKKIIFFFLKNFTNKKYAICLKFTPTFIFIICKFFRIKIIYDCDDLIWLDNFFGKKKTKLLFSLSSYVVLENSFLKNFFLNFNKSYENINVINCPLPDFELKKKKIIKKNFIPTYIYAGSKYAFEQVFPLLELIDSQNKWWNLIFLGSYIDKTKYSFLKNLIYLPSYNSRQMCTYLDMANVGLYSKAISDFDKGRGFHKKLIYLSRGLPIISTFSHSQKITSKSHINLDNCWNEDELNKKYKQLFDLRIISRWNYNINKKIKNIINF